MTSRRSAVDRLRTLPALFRGTDLTLRFGWSSKTASQYVYLWRRTGLVEPFGGHADVFANRLVADEPDWESALVMAMPSALIVGIESIRRAGWTTQIPARPQVAIHASSTLYSTMHFMVERRDAAWFERVQNGVVRGDGGHASVLSAPYALVDLIEREGWGACGLDPDDLDVDMLRVGDRNQLSRAARALGSEDALIANMATLCSRAATRSRYPSPR